MYSHTYTEHITAEIILKVSLMLKNDKKCNLLFKVPTEEITEKKQNETQFKPFENQVLKIHKLFYVCSLYASLYDIC